MKTVFLAVVLILSSSLFSTAGGFTDKQDVKNFKLNNNVGPAEITFISDAPLERIKGTVDKEVVSSMVKMNTGKPEMTTGKVSFKVTGMQTGIRKRDGHLQSHYWLDAEKYPDITFELKSLKNVKIMESSGGKSTAEAVAVGKYNMHGKSKDIEVRVKLIYIKESAATKKRASGDLLSVEGDFEIALADFEVVGANNIVGRKVGKTIIVNFKLFYNES